MFQLKSTEIILPLSCMHGIFVVMKNIIAITLTILAILLAGFLINKYMQSQDTDLTTFLPETFNTSRQLTLFNQDMLPEDRIVTLGVDGETDFQVKSTQGQYRDENGKLSLSMWIEEVSKDDFAQYKKKAWERYQSREGLTEQQTLSNHDVYLSFRDIKEGDDTSVMVTMGGGYVFFPEKNVVVTYTFFNPRLYACEDIQKPETCMFDAERVLPTIDDDKKVAEQLITAYLGAN